MSDSGRSQFSGLDQLIVQFDQALRTLVPGSSAAQRPSPAARLEDEAFR
jgi:ubiquinone biosynthesis monooxygenase Coq7